MSVNDLDNTRAIADLYEQIKGLSDTINGLQSVFYFSPAISQKLAEARAEREALERQREVRILIRDLDEAIAGADPRDNHGCLEANLNAVYRLMDRARAASRMLQIQVDRDASTQA